MSFSSRDTLLYRKDARSGHKLLTPEERLEIVKPYLPSPPKSNAARTETEKAGSHSDSGHAGHSGHSSANKFHLRDTTRERFSVRSFVAHQLYVLVYTIVHAIFSVYRRFRVGYHGVRDRIYSVLKYHHRTPEIIARDVRDLRRLPKHLSVVLQLEDNGHGLAELERLVNEVSDIAAWCASAGIPMLSVYERTGILKSYLADTHRAVSHRLTTYFGRVHPAVTLQAPHLPSIESTVSPHARENGETDDGHITVMLLSEEDGRDSLVDLTRTLSEMAQRSKISPSDISIDLIDAELTESVMAEPDLLLLFGPHIELSGYPPWQIRLTEIFHLPDNQSVGYQVFLSGLYRYAGAEFRVGR
ncbi:di-cis-decaprenylcistransferase [Sporothrix brasiliensis 5110]|uniref:ditrans,polycis-polyprenyl diphosphate synthase [(2E,6E)-farnesyldiphosphate specific] n=1 Tax=Sporothrix brasiliensis 5110 TaxID=1398154 RepID=A0A0C2EQ73_9PEZI|nr:di-cis-decaprenylcistransferase [Sporothrix brasiliensis 5110]KIH88484.1 di-cis-decaprenylcistransferase [Sporothrix brasiliensis 5110]